MAVAFAVLLAGGGVEGVTPKAKPAKGFGSAVLELAAVEEGVDFGMASLLLEVGWAPNAKPAKGAGLTAFAAAGAAECDEEADAEEAAACACPASFEEAVDVEGVDGG